MVLSQLGQLICTDNERRELLLASGLNGIDYIEVPWDDQRHVRVFFVSDLFAIPSMSDVTISGGVRIRDIEVVATSAAVEPVTGTPYLEVTVNETGDFSPYELAIGAPGVLDPRFDNKLFSFKAGCPTDIDCADVDDCPPTDLVEPIIDYMAKDYASFRQLLLDQLSTHVPEWTERHAADLGIALVELLSYQGDYLSYRQDAVGNEMYLETARQRESVRRHVALVDYSMHQGLSARSFMHLDVDTQGDIPARDTQFVTRITQVLDPTTGQPPETEIAPAHAADATRVADTVFEAVTEAHLDPALNRTWIHTWNDVECCLPVGATKLDLVGNVPLVAGDLLLLEEVKGSGTGLARDADKAHRQVVRLIANPTVTTDPLMTGADVEGGVAALGAGDPELEVTMVEWSRDDALTFPLCVSAVVEDERVFAMSVARGNIVLVDHGLRVDETHRLDASSVMYSGVAQRTRLEQGPLTYGTRWQRAGDPSLSGSVSSIFRLEPRDAEPAVVMVDGGGAGLVWTPEPTLLDSDSFSRSFVAEPGNDGRALLRFGDGDFGMAPPMDEELSVIYRVGNGRAGNIGPETLVHVIKPETLEPGAVWPTINSVRNPLPGMGGVDPEPLEKVKQTAPDAFRAETFRAVTEDDYARATEKLPGVSHAISRFRWTGSWYTVFTAVDPIGTDDPLSELPELRTDVLRQLTVYRQAGYDLEIPDQQYGPLDIAIEICVALEHFRSSVRVAVMDALSARVLRSGSLGFFHPDNFTFGQPLYLSELYAAVEAVAGVDSAEVTRFQRYGESANGELASAVVLADEREILRLNNDRNFPEYGVLELEMEAGK
jgi:hypothetical protein